MTATEPSLYSLQLNRVLGPSLCPSKRWYAVSSEWFNRPRDFSAGALLKDEIVEVSIYDLIDQNGARVIPSLCGSTWKKDVVVVSTLFGILARASRKNNQNENKVLSSIEFKAIKDIINGLPIEEMARTKEFPANVPDTPPSSPKESKQPHNVSPCSAETKTPFETLENLESVSMGPRLKMRQSGAVAKRCVDEVQDRFTSSGSLLGKAFGYIGFLYCDQMRQDYIKDAVSTTLSTVAQKQGIRKAIHNMLHDELNQQYLESIRVPDWIQLYVKLSTMIPNRSWQTLLNFLNIGRTGKSTDVALLLTANEIRAQKELVFSVTRNLFKLEPHAAELRGYGISLKAALIWQIRQSRLHQEIPESGVLEFNLKLDGRPLAVTLDLKALYMLIVKLGDETFVLGGRGIDIEFCFLCHALQACKEHWGGSYDEVCLTCLQSKANIGKWSGICDDLTFLLDEELSSVCLCALHSEMRNTEQLLGSLGLFAYRCNALDECNKAISQYGPELSRGHDRITVKLPKGQQTAVNKNNISVASFSGNTERSILENIADIIHQSLPLNKVISYYKEVKGASRDVVLGYVTFTNAGINWLFGLPDAAEELGLFRLQL